MKSKKILLVFAIAVILMAGWGVSVRSSTGAEVIATQKKLVTQADQLAERQLYVRAIELYKEALQNTTDLTPDIQKKLLDTYKEYGDMSSYCDMVDLRVGNDTAKEEEYLNAAVYYEEHANLKESVPMLEKGIEKLDSEKLREYLEEIRYQYTLNIVGYKQVLPTEDNSLMPAFDGEKWGYIDDSGRTELEFAYDAAIAFGASGYAVVRQNDNFYSILKNGDWYGADDGSSYEKMSDIIMVSGTHVLGKRNGSYSYFDYDFAPVAESFQFENMTGNACGVAAVCKDGKWGIITDAGKSVTDYVYEDVAVNSLGNAFAADRAMVKENGMWHLIDTEGKKIGDSEFDNAKAPESSGYIAVADEQDNWGYIDHDGTLIIDYQYRDAKSFSNKLGAVQSVNDWGYISESNEKVIDEPLQSAEPFHNGIAQADTAEGMALIKLEYFENE